MNLRRAEVRGAWIVTLGLVLLMGIAGALTGCGNGPREVETTRNAGPSMGAS